MSTIPRRRLVAGLAIIYGAFATLALRIYLLDGLVSTAVMSTLAIAPFLLLAATAIAYAVLLRHTFFCPGGDPP